MMGNETYNGWTNRETWAWGLLVDNDQYLQEHFVEVCVGERACMGEGLLATKYRVGDWLENAFTEMVEESQYDGGGHEVELAFRREVGSFWRINWAELGEHYAVMVDEYEGSEAADGP